MQVYVHCNEFAAKQQRKKQTKGKHFLWKWATSIDGPAKSTVTRQGWKHKRLLYYRKSWWRKARRLYSTSIAQSYSITQNCGEERLGFYTLHLLHILLWISVLRYSSFVFIPALFRYFLEAHPYLFIFTGIHSRVGFPINISLVIAFNDYLRCVHVFDSCPCVLHHFAREHTALSPRSDL